MDWYGLIHALSNGCCRGMTTQNATNTLTNTTSVRTTYLLLCATAALTPLSNTAIFHRDHMLVALKQLWLQVTGKKTPTHDVCRRNYCKWDRITWYQSGKSGCGYRFYGPRLILIEMMVFNSIRAEKMHAIQVVMRIVCSPLLHVIGTEITDPLQRK